MKIFAPNFARLFSRLVFINVLILSEITSRMRNWHNAKLSSDFAITHRYFYGDATFRTVIAKFTEKVETELRKIDK